jgi:hypothetical protein
LSFSSPAAVAEAQASGHVNGLVAYSERDPRDPFGRLGLWVMNPNGSNARLLLPSLRVSLSTSGLGDCDVVAITYPTWSPDGRRIAFMGSLDLDHGPAWSASCGYRGPDAPRRLFVANADGSGVRVLDTQHGTFSHGNGLSDVRPSWSPDGRTLIRVDSGPHGYVRRFNADGSGFEYLIGPERGSSIREAHLSPDGRFIALIRQSVVSSPALPVETIHIRTVATGAERQILSGLTVFSTPGAEPSQRRILGGWSPNSEELVFSQRAAPQGIYVVAADGSNLRQIAAGTRFVDLSGELTTPRFSPDGRWIVTTDVDPNSQGIGLFRNQLKLIAVDPAQRRAAPLGRAIAPRGLTPDWQPCHLAGGCLFPQLTNTAPALSSFSRLVLSTTRTKTRRGHELRVWATAHFTACDTVGDGLAARLRKDIVLSGRTSRGVFQSYPLMDSLRPRRTAECRAYVRRFVVFTSVSARTPPTLPSGVVVRVTLQVEDGFTYLGIPTNDYGFQPPILRSRFLTRTARLG